MKIKYSRDADVLMIKLREGKPTDSRDIAEGIIVHLTAKGQPLEIEILDASKVVQKKDIELLDASQRTTRKPLDLTDLAIVKSSGSDAVRESGETYRRKEKAKTKRLCS